MRGRTVAIVDEDADEIWQHPIDQQPTTGSRTTTTTATTTTTVGSVNKKAKKFKPVSVLQHQTSHDLDDLPRHPKPSSSSSSATTTTKTIYRDSSGRKISAESLTQSATSTSTAAARIQTLQHALFTSESSVRRKQQVQGELERAATSGFARYAHDEEMNRRLRERTHWEDPMLNKTSYKSKSKQKRRSSSSEKEGGFEAGPNRFGIKAGKEWDGVDRSNGFEKQWFRNKYELEDRKRRAYEMSVEDIVFILEMPPKKKFMIASDTEGASTDEAASSVDDQQQQLLRLKPPTRIPANATTANAIVNADAIVNANVEKVDHHERGNGVEDRSVSSYQTAQQSVVSMATSPPSTSLSANTSTDVNANVNVNVVMGKVGFVSFTQQRMMLQRQQTLAEDAVGPGVMGSPDPGITTTFSPIQQQQQPSLMPSLMMDKSVAVTPTLAPTPDPSTHHHHHQHQQHQQHVQEQRQLQRNIRDMSRQAQVQLELWWSLGVDPMRESLMRVFHRLPAHFIDQNVNKS